MPVYQVNPNVLCNRLINKNHPVYDLNCAQYNPVF